MPSPSSPAPAAPTPTAPSSPSTAVPESTRTDPPAIADQDWRTLNRAHWDEVVPIHRAVPYGRGSHADRTAQLHPQTIAELGPVTGLRLLHLQCHFGHDSLVLATQGADVTGLDFSFPAIEAARADSEKFGIPARFIHADLYDAPNAIPEPASFDRVFITWGTICWLPDIARWAQIVAHFLRPGGRLYFADMHPVAYVFDDQVPSGSDRPGWFDPYFGGAPCVIDDVTDYADPEARLVHHRTVTFLHPVSSIVGALLDAGLQVDWLHEHPTIAWRPFKCLVPNEQGWWTWPDRPWFPLSLSLSASKPQS